MVFSLKHIDTTNDSKVTKFLGIHLDSELTWQAHGSKVADKISKNTYLVRRLSDCVSKDVLRLAYFH